MNFDSIDHSMIFFRSQEREDFFKSIINEAEHKTK
jgi:hypothetical protein